MYGIQLEKFIFALAQGGFWNSHTCAETYIHTYLSLPISLKCIFALVQECFLNSGGSKRHDRQRVFRCKELLNYSCMYVSYVCMYVWDVHTYILKPSDKYEMHFSPCTRAFFEFWGVEKAWQAEGFQIKPLCRYVCMYVRTYVCMYVRTYVCTYVRMHVCIYMYVYTYLYVCRHACMYVCMSACVCMHICVYVCMFVCMHACMYVCMHACM